MHRYYQMTFAQGGALNCPIHLKTDREAIAYVKGWNDLVVRLGLVDQLIESVELMTSASPPGAKDEEEFHEEIVRMLWPESEPLEDAIKNAGPAALWDDC